jgi:hypothetical protein
MRIGRNTPASTSTRTRTQRVDRLCVKKKGILTARSVVYVGGATSNRSCELSHGGDTAEQTRSVRTVGLWVSNVVPMVQLSCNVHCCGLECVAAWLLNMLAKSCFGRGRPSSSRVLFRNLVGERKGGDGERRICT